MFYLVIGKNVIIDIVFLETFVFFLPITVLHFFLFSTFLHIYLSIVCHILFYSTDKILRGNTALNIADFEKFEYPTDYIY